MRGRAAALMSGAHGFKSWLQDLLVCDLGGMVESLCLSLLISKSEEAEEAGDSCANPKGSS